MTPEDLAEMERVRPLLDDPMYRLSHLYKIVSKGDDDDEEGLVITFKPNRAQRRLLARLHTRNIILKARQLGFTTLVCILWLDTALFAKEPIRCGIVAQDREAAEAIFRGKVKFAYDKLPDWLRAEMPLSKATSTELEFGHNKSSIRVATSMRSGTIHRLLVSEFGKISAKFPDKAREVVTGSIPAVPKTGIAVIESTAEGQDGHFYTMTQRAQALADQGVKLGVKDWRMHFFAWWMEPNYSVDDDIEHTEAELEYFNAIEAKIGRVLTAGQRAWYATTCRNDFGGEAPLMWQEYPSTCVSGETLVATPRGMVRIKDVEPDGQVIKNWMDQGVKPVFKLRTRLGYTLVCTADHRLLCADGDYRRLDEVGPGQALRMAQPSFGHEVQTIEYAGAAPFVRNTIEISAEFALFLGFIMGDGCYHDGTVSIACDALDLDTVQTVESLMVKFLGGAGSRVTGEKKGCLEVRKAGVAFRDPLLALGVIEQRNNGGYKRRVHVPEYIMQSPREVCAAFLRGLFEADGFASRDGCNIKFFSKHEHVCLDVQRLLLAFGIEARVSSQDKSAGNGAVYEGWELVLRADGVRKFAVDIGFVSARKQQRAELSLTKRKTGSARRFEWEDPIASIAPAGEERVYDITTRTSNFIAGGIVVHNCEEAFQVSTEGCYYATQLALARKQGRIMQRMPIESAPVNTFWDIGRGDMTCIWFHQKIGMEHRFINYYEASGEDLIHYTTHMQTMGYVWGRHYLPHEADHKRIGETPDTNRSIKEMLENLMPGQSFEIVPRITALQTGIQATRNAFASAYFHEANTHQGVKRLSGYRKKWDKTRGRWGDEHEHNDDSHGADSFRQWGQSVDSGVIFPTGFAASRPSNARGFVRRGSPMAV